MCAFMCIYVSMYPRSIYSIVFLFNDYLVKLSFYLASCTCLLFTFWLFSTIFSDLLFTFFCYRSFFVLTCTYFSTDSVWTICLLCYSCFMFCYRVVFVRCSIYPIGCLIGIHLWLILLIYYLFGVYVAYMIIVNYLFS